MNVERVGKYRLIALLGQGGMASVYLSVVPGPAGVNKLLVVKLLREELAHDEDFVAMFLNEGRLATRLNHANVVQTYEVGIAQAEGRPGAPFDERKHHFLAMDYLDGQPLHAVLRKAGRRGMPLDVHVRVLAEALAGLHYAHTLRDFDGSELRVVHRDVSPQNVFVTYDGQVKVVDFGIAKAAGAANTTQSGVFKGKLSYVSPEQAGGEVVDARADIFSVGIMLWEAMAGRRFVTSDTQTAILGRRLTGAEPRIREVLPDADPELADVCDRAMARYPDDRFSTAEEFHAALERVLERGRRRVAAREAGRFVAELFVEERERIRLVIDEQMKQLQRETATALPMPTIDVFPGAGDPTPITTVDGRAKVERAARALHESRHDTPSTGSRGTLVAANISQGPPAAKAGRAVLAGLVALVVALAGLLGVVIAAKSASPSPAAGAAAADSTASADAARIRLSITFGPPGAVAKLDGVPLAESPFVAQVRRDGSMHRIDVEGPGLAPETRMVSYEKDVTIAVSLAARPVTMGGEPPSEPEKKPARPESGPLKPRPPKALGIDEKDPYKQ
jgi:serine/threonine-protein kinase